MVDWKTQEFLFTPNKTQTFVLSDLDLKNIHYSEEKSMEKPWNPIVSNLV